MIADDQTRAEDAGRHLREKEKRLSPTRMTWKRQLLRTYHSRDSAPLGDRRPDPQLRRNNHQRVIYWPMTFIQSQKQNSTQLLKRVFRIILLLLFPIVFGLSVFVAMMDCPAPKEPISDPDAYKFMDGGHGCGYPLYTRPYEPNFVVLTVDRLFAMLPIGIWWYAFKKTRRSFVKN